MERRATSPSSNSFSDTDSYEDSNSIDEVEATLNNLDDELADTEQALSTWSSQTPSTGYGSYMGSGSGTYTGNGTYTPSGTFTGTNTTTQTGQGSYTGSPSFVSLPSLFSPTAGSSSLQSSYPPPSNDPRIRLSHITERTEGTESRPVSGVSYATTVPARPRSAFLSSGAGRHSRSSTDPSDLPPPGRANQLIGLFESGSTSRSPSPTKNLLPPLDHLTRLLRSLILRARLRKARSLLPYSPLPKLVQVRVRVLQKAPNRPRRLLPPLSADQPDRKALQGAR
ncbi:hypothetical protein GGU10DRAFT_180659 [Lentinula aff. detonsa]|uniref:Uncharacterized protein n=1 Tax=Lentinula aff. detonsa TaxID=2804958 RepID=A0AA38KSQ8_9AGAR|nr:hypothetical protein GGU10DRAFT_180659 [Lentinula aff. detonsa]